MSASKLKTLSRLTIGSARGESDFAAATAHGGRPKAGLSGFVAFMKRRDAESAVKELDGFDWGGSILRVGWGKMVRLPARPLYGEKASGFRAIGLF